MPQKRKTRPAHLPGRTPATGVSCCESSKRGENGGGEPLRCCEHRGGSGSGNQFQWTTLQLDPVEGACKSLVKDRMERSGMRWTEEMAEAIRTHPLLSNFSIIMANAVTIDMKARTAMNT